MKKEILDQLKTSIGHIEACIQLMRLSSFHPEEVRNLREQIRTTEDIIRKIEAQEVFILTGPELASMKEEAYEKGAIDEYKAGL